MEEHKAGVCVGVCIFTYVDVYVCVYMDVQHLIYDIKVHTKYEKIAML